MDQDREQRITDLERQLAELKRVAGGDGLRARSADPITNLGSQGFNAGQQDGFPPPPVGWQHPSQTPQLNWPPSANAGSKTKRGRRSMRTWFTSIAAAGFALLGFAFVLAPDFNGYRVGTSATATVTHCSSGKGGSCEGTWSIGGVSQTGQIEHGFRTPSVGSSLNVRVSHGKAYMATSWLPSLAWQRVWAAVDAVALDRCEAEPVPAYLEASKSELVPYYQRFGFEMTGEIKLPKGGPSPSPLGFRCRS